MPADNLFLQLLNAKNEPQFLNDSAMTLAQLTGADECDILTVDQGGNLLLEASTWSPDYNMQLRVGPNIGLVGKAVREQIYIHIDRDISLREDYATYPGFDETQFNAALLIPIQNEDEVIACVYLRKRVFWPHDDDEIFQNRQLIEKWALMWQSFVSGYQAGTESPGMDYLSEVSKTLSQSPYLEEILQLLVQITARRFDYKVVTVRLLEEKSQELVLRATQATNRAYQKKRAIKLGESIAGQAILDGCSIVVEDVQNDPNYIGHDLAEAQGLRSMVCVPLIVHGKPVGVISCYTKEKRPFSEEEIAILETSAKQAAVSIEHAKLQVRDTLMQEMHHRVKNNLQQVASLLRIQIRQSHYKTLEEALTDSLNRILAIASVHELLSRDDLDHASIKKIAESLTQHQKQSFLMPGKTIVFQVRGDDVFLNTTQATQVSLVLNEMIQNAVEHGFDVANEGQIHVTVEDLGEEIGIWVSNDGDTLPPDFDPTKGGRLGLQIIRSLVKGLGGHFKIEDRDGWTVCEVIFAKNQSE